MVIEIQCGMWIQREGERYGVKIKTKEKEKQLKWDLNMDTEGQDTKDGPCTSKRSLTLLGTN